MQKTKFLEVDFKQREYDGKWMRLAKVEDLENSYTYITENKQKITIVPTMWIIVGVYDLLLEIQD